LRLLHVGDDFLGHPNGEVLTPFILLNLVSNHFVFALLFYHIDGAFAFVLLVGIGVDERTLDGKILLVLLIWKLFLWLRAFIGLAAFLMTLE